MGKKVRVGQVEGRRAGKTESWTGRNAGRRERRMVEGSEGGACRGVKSRGRFVV